MFGFIGKAICSLWAVGSEQYSFIYTNYSSNNDNQNPKKEEKRDPTLNPKKITTYDAIKRKK